MNNHVELDLERLPLYGLFALVVKHQSFSEAARLTGLARSAVSQRIQRLEASVQTQLLRRTTRRVTPTEAGLQLFEKCAPLLQQAEALGHSAQAEAVRPLRVNAPLSLVHACLGELLLRFQAEQPGPVDLTLENRTIDLLETRDDVVVRVSRELSAEVVARQLSQTALRVVAAPAYLAEVGVPQAPQDLVHHRCLRYSPSTSSSEWRFGRGQRSYTVPVSGPFIASDGSVLKRLALAGSGLAVLPTFMIAEELEAGTLVPVLEPWLRPPLVVWAILPAGRRSTKRARALVDFLSKHLDSVLPTTRSSRRGA